jgi:hypothetical protein
MIIDLILNRQAGGEYNPKEFYNEVMQYGDIGHKISGALDDLAENDVKKALCNYIINNDYNAEICNYINSTNWLK